MKQYLNDTLEQSNMISIQRKRKAVMDLVNAANANRLGNTEASRSRLVGRAATVATCLDSAQPLPLDDAVTMVTPVEPIDGDEHSGGDDHAVAIAAASSLRSVRSDGAMLTRRRSGDASTMEVPEVSFFPTNEEERQAVSEPRAE